MVQAPIKKKKLLLALPLLVGFMTSCRKEFKSPSWDVNLNAPLLYSDMGIEDVVPDSLIQVNADNSINLVFDQKFFSYGIDSVVKLPDSVITENYFSPFTSTFPAGGTIFSSTENNRLTLNDAELTAIHLQHGYIDYKITSTVNDPVEVSYAITTAIQHGGPLAISVEVPAAPSGGTFIKTGTYDLEGAQLDLTGILHNSVNAYQTKFTVKAPAGSGVNVAAGTSTISIEIKFRDMIPSYARGYFGHIVDETALEEQSFDFFKNINTATLDLSQVDAKLYISNGLGADARIRIDTVQALNTNTGSDVLLSHAIMGQNVNINRAQDLAYAALPYDYSVDVTSSNSNIEPFLESLPDKLRYKLNVELNPLGNVSGHTDFLYPNSRVEAGMHLDIPLNLIAANLTLTDTLDFNLDDYDQGGKILKGRMKFNVVNGLPLAANLEVIMLDENNMQIGYLLGPVNIDGNPASTSFSEGFAVYQTLYSELTEENLNAAYRSRKLVIRATFNTVPASTFVSIYNTQRFKTQISVQADYRINQE